MELIKKIYQLFDSFQGRLFRYALAFSLLLAIAPILIAVILVFKYSKVDYLVNHIVYILSCVILANTQEYHQPLVYLSY